MSPTTHASSAKPHQRLTSSGVVVALKTSSAGASKVRVMRYEVSDGSVMTAEPCLLAMVLSLFMVFPLWFGARRADRRADRDACSRCARRNAPSHMAQDF